MVFAISNDGTSKIKRKHVQVFLLAASIFTGAFWWIITNDTTESLIAFAVPWIIAAILVIISVIFGLPMIPFMYILRRAERQRETQHEK